MNVKSRRSLAAVAAVSVAAAIAAPVAAADDPPAAQVTPNVKVSLPNPKIDSKHKFKLKVECPAPQVQCVGSVGLDTLNAINPYGKGYTARRAVIGGTQFTIAGGQSKLFTLRVLGPALAQIYKTGKVKAKMVVHVAAEERGADSVQTGVLTLTGKRR